MKKIGNYTKVCDHCGEEHEVQIVNIKGQAIIKGETVEFVGSYEYCDILDEMSAEGEMLTRNNVARKDAYKQKMGLLTSDDIRQIRTKYLISQKDLALILGWGSSTITRYETVQIQDEAHNDVLCLVRDNPKWFLDKLISKKEVFKKANKGKTYTKYYNCIALQINEKSFFSDAFKAAYLYKKVDPIYYGDTDFDFEKIIEMINYIAGKVQIHKVKLMKMLWYSDALSYKRRGKSISGMAYVAIQMGAVPKDYELLVQAEGVDYEVVYYEKDNETVEGYLFHSNSNIEINNLSDEDRGIIDVIVAKFGDMTTKEIVNEMHKETAFEKTLKNELISFEYARELSVD